MNYRLVKQFWVHTVDNFFNFFYKIWDFIKIWVDVFWAFVDIWLHFFAIFQNLFLYVFYFFLFIIDKTTESRISLPFSRRTSGRPFSPARAYNPDVYNPVPAMYGGSKAAGSVSPASGSAKGSTSSGSGSVRSMRTEAKGARTSIIKTILEFFRNLIEIIASIFTTPVRIIGNFFSRRMKPVKEEAPSSQAGGGLIDEYLKEYEQKRQR